MSSKGGAIHFEITASNDDLKRKLAESRQAILNSGKTAEAEGAKIDGMFKRAAIGAGAFFTAQQAISFAKQIAIVRGEFQQLEVAFTTMLGSKPKADALMAQMVDTAAKTPFDLQSVAGGAKQLLAYGSASEKVNEELIMLGNIAAGLSIPLGDMVYLYGTTQTQGRLYTQDMRQFMGRGIPLADELAKQLGKTKEEIAAMVTAGKIGFPEVQKALQSMTGAGGKFNNLMEEQSKTITGQISNLGDAIDVMFNNMGRSQEGVISSVIGGATSLVENYEKVGRILASLIVTYGVYRAALMLVSATSKGCTIAQLAHNNALLLTEKAQKLLNATMLKNPYVLAAVLITGVVTALWALHDSTSANEKAQKEYNDGKEKTAQLEQEHKNKIDDLIKSATDENLATLTRTASLQELKRKYPEIFAQYDIEKLKLADILAIKLKIAEIDAEKKMQSNKDNVAELQTQYDKAKGDYDSFMSTKDIRGKLPNQGNLIGKAYKRKVDEAAEALKLAQKDVQEDITNEWIANVNNLSDKQLQAELVARKRLESTIDHNKRNNIKTQAEIKGGTLSGSFSEEQIQEQTNALQVELKKRGVKLYTYSQLVQKYTKDIAIAQKKLAESKNNKKGLSEDALNKEIADKQSELDFAEKALKTLTGGKINSGPKDADNLNKLLLDIEKSYQDSKIALMKDGQAKELAQIDLDTKERVDAEKKKYADLEKEQGGKLTKDQSEKRDITISSINTEGNNRQVDVKEKYAREYIKLQQEMTLVQATEEERRTANIKQKYDEQRAALGRLLEGGAISILEWGKARASLNNNEEFENLEPLLKELETYEQKRTNIQTEYATKRQMMYEKDGKTLKKGVTQGNVDELNRNEQEAYNAVDEQFAQREETYQAWMNKIADNTLEQLEAVLKHAEKELEDLTKSGSTDDKQLSVARAKVSTARTKVSKAKAEDVASPGKRTLKEWQDLYGTLQDIESEFKNIGDTVGGVAGDIVSTAGTIMSSTLSMINGIVQLVNMSSVGMQATSIAAASAISTVEKASIILTIISAAMQIAMTIINLFNNDKQYQKEIDNLQDRIDQLQWELDNADAVLLKKNSFDVLVKIKELYAETTSEVLKLHEANSLFGNTMNRMFGGMIYKNEIMQKSAEKLATAYANIEYTADKALGSEKFSGAKEQLNNIAQQQLLIQQQINNEDAKKKTDHGKIQDWERQIQELGVEANKIINEIVEGIIGGSASDIASELGDAFIEAFQNGENAAEAWGDKVDDIVANVLKRMLVSKFLEEPLGEIFNKYKAKWYKDGEFAGIDAIMESMGGFANDLNGVGDEFQTIWDTLPDSIKNMFAPDEADREAVSRGIATASQESVDENNGRLTAIQGHTFELNENVKLISPNIASIKESMSFIRDNAAAQLVALHGIQNNTAPISEMKTELGYVKSVLETIRDKGLIIR